MKLFTNYLAIKDGKEYIVQTDGTDLYVNIYNDNGAGRHTISKKVDIKDKELYSIKREATKAEVKTYSLVENAYKTYKSTIKGVNR